MDRYLYSALNEDAHEIRLLVLHPEEFDARLSVSLDTIPLKPCTGLLYEALSYTWGSSASKTDVVMVRDEHDYALGVTKSLATALQYLRLKDKPRVLWIDAICVNQENLDERSAQVRKMGDIYRLAEKVVVWIGAGRDGSSTAMEVLDSIGSDFEVDWPTRIVSSKTTGLPLDPQLIWTEKSSRFSIETWRAVYNLLDRSWFKRLWIWQEISLAAKGSVLMCGTDSIMWEHFRTAIFRLQQHGTTITPKLDLPLGPLVASILDLCDSEDNKSLRTLISRTSGCQCTDPRDRMYALLGMVAGVANHFEIIPNYKRSVHGVYKDLVLNDVRAERVLNFLTFSEMHVHSEDWQTWVPDLANPGKAAAIWTPRAGGRSLAKAEYNGTTTLTVTGVLSATVNNIQQSIAYPTASNADILKWIRSISIPDQDEAYVGGGTIRDAIFRALIMNLFSERFIPGHAEYPDFIQTKMDFDQATASQPTNITPSLSRYLSCVKYWSQYRTFFTSDEGYVGWVPNVTEPGDKICILLGCDTPIVLRPYKDDRWLVIGQCFVYGLMETEALLGSLPQQVICVDIFDEESSEYHTGFLDRRTRHMSPEDPRLGPLPDGWRIHNHAKSMFWSWYANDGMDESGIGQRSLEDPRITVEAIKTRSVDLRTFDLV